MPITMHGVQTHHPIRIRELVIIQLVILAITDRIIEDGSFLRLNNITIGYDLPVENSKLFERFNIFVTAQNLHVWTNYSGYNPEISSFSYDGLRNGVDWNGSPDAKNISFGVNINF